MAQKDRYSNRPILLVLEYYTLAVIGELAPEKATQMRDVVQHLWRGGSDWMSTVRRELGFDASFDESIKSNWQGYQKAAAKQKKSTSAFDFARMFADAVEKECRPAGTS